MTAGKDIRSLSREDLRTWMKEAGEAVFRGDQVYDWLWTKQASSFEAMSNLPKALRARLEVDFSFPQQSLATVQRSADGTLKNAVQLHDGLVVESVLIPTEKRITACVSSQVGCSLNCAFCATAKLKRMRNLEPHEIFDQVVTIHRQGLEEFGRPLTNIVFMGMGEPLLNYPNVLSAIERITAPDGLGLSPKRITLSTVGLPKMIVKMADEGVKFNLAVSLHSARNEVRSSMMPINEVSPIEEVVAAVQHWYRLTKRRITFEYVVWKGINDGPEDIAALVKVCKKVPCKVNLIEYNAIGDPRFLQADPAALEAYQTALAAAGIVAKVRRSRGKDIDAACGQLANK